MRIATVTPYDLSVPGGVNHYALDLSAWLRSQGHDVDVIGPASSRHGTTPANVTVLGRPHAVAAGGTVAPIVLSPTLGGEIRDLLRRGRYDVIHLHEPLMPLLPLQFLRAAGDSLTVGTFHAAEPLGRRLYRLAGPALTRWTRRLDGRTAISRTALEIAAPALGGPAQIIPGCTDFERFARPRPPPPDLDPGRRTILFVGRGEPRKGLPDLIDAYGILRARHPHLQLVVVGPAGPLGPGLRRRVRAAGWSEVRFVGPVSSADLPRYYQAAHVFCAPASGGEAFGLVLTEAMAAGAPVVAGDNDGYRDVVRHGRDGILVPPHDPPALAAALERVLTDGALRERLRAAGRARARSFSVEAAGAQFLALYDSLTAERAERRVTPERALR